MSVVMVFRVVLLAALFCGCLPAPLKPEADNRNMFHMFQDMFGGGMNMMMGAANGMSQTMGAGVDTAMKVFGDMSPPHWGPFGSNPGPALASVLSSVTVKPNTETDAPITGTPAPTTVAPTTSTPAQYHWITFGGK